MFITKSYTLFFISSYSFLLNFQRYSSAITEKSPTIFILPFFFISSHFSPVNCMSFLACSFQLVLGFRHCRFPSISVCRIFLSILCSVICITCTNHSLFTPILVILANRCFVAGADTVPQDTKTPHLPGLTAETAEDSA